MLNFFKKNRSDHTDNKEAERTSGNAFNPKDSDIHQDQSFGRHQNQGFGGHQDQGFGRHQSQSAGKYQRHGQPQDPDVWFLIDETNHIAYKLGHEPVWIGRDKSCQIQLQDQYCSRRHARIIGREENCIITDLNTVNGLEVDGQFICNGEETLLEENSNLKISNTQFYLTRSLPDKGLPGKGMPVRDLTGHLSSDEQLTAGGHPASDGHLTSGGHPASDGHLASGGHPALHGQKISGEPKDSYNQKLPYSQQGTCGQKVPYYNPEYEDAQEQHYRDAQNTRDDRTVVLSGNYGFEDTMYFTGMGAEEYKPKDYAMKDRVMNDYEGKNHAMNDCAMKDRVMNDYEGKNHAMNDSEGKNHAMNDSEIKKRAINECEIKDHDGHTEKP